MTTFTLLESVGGVLTGEYEDPKLSCYRYIAHSIQFSDDGRRLVQPRGYQLTCEEDGSYVAAVDGLATVRFSPRRQ